jgi:hypothetical protein
VNFQNEFGAKVNTVFHSSVKLRDIKILYEEEQRNYGGNSLRFSSY